MNIPGWGKLRLEHLVLDLNGAIALDGELQPGVAEAVEQLKSEIQIHLVTTDASGDAERLFGQGVDLVTITSGRGGAQKQSLVYKLGWHGVAAVGSGANDAAMLLTARLGICTLSEEGAARDALIAADVVAPSAASALRLLLNPKRLQATLHY